MADGDVVIRLRDVWDVATLTEQKVDLVVLAVADMRDKTLPDHETRIRGLEKWRYAFPSIATLIAAGALIVAILGLVNGSNAVSLKRHTTTPTTAATTPQVTIVSAPTPTTTAGAPAAAQALSVPTTAPKHRTHPTAPVSVPTSPVVTLPRVTVPSPVTSLAEALERLPQTVGVKLP